VALRLAINGFGRIGRCVTRALVERQADGDALPLELVHVNELASLDTMAYLCRYDSTHGRFPGQVVAGDDWLELNGRTVRVTHEPDATRLPWRAQSIDMVLECTGVIGDRAGARAHLEAGAARVLFSQPASPDVDATVVFGINHQLLHGSERIVSAASCTTNCIVPVIATLHRAFGVAHGVITTIHSAMNDQPVLDAYHHTDLRKTRAAARSIIPVDTALAAGIGRILPELAGRFEAQAMRVPTLNVSAMDLSVLLDSDVDAAAVNAAFAAAADDRVLGYTEEPLASCDFIHDPRSGIVDASQTRVSGRRLVKVLTWFDNEWGFANRMLDVALHWAQTGGLLQEEPRG
jgi:erythrose-4-phosphate dehydrogenase